MNNYPDIYQMVTDRIIELLESGTVPWKHFADSPYAGMPCNLITKKPYRGINAFLLSATKFSSPYWLTYKQAKQKGGYVRAGEQSQLVVFWKKVKIEKVNPETGTKEEKDTLFLRYYRVFNVEQCEGLKGVPSIDANDNSNNPIDEAAKVVDNMPNRPMIKHTRKPVAYYKPSTDEITMCALKNCKSSSQYYTTLFHELVHSTGHKSRLNRFAEKDAEVFASMGGKANYAAEELVAEMGAAMLAAHVGIFQTEETNMASYIKGWLQALKNDRKMVVFAAAKAQKAAEYIYPNPTANESEEEDAE